MVTAPSAVAVRAMAADQIEGGEATWYAVAVSQPALSLGVVRLTMRFNGRVELACDCGATAPGRPCAHLVAVEDHLAGGAARAASRRTLAHAP